MNFINKNTLLSELSKKDSKDEAYFKFGGKLHKVDVNIVNGEMETIELNKPVGEMITSASTVSFFLKKVVLDLEMGKAKIPLLYKDLYDTKEDRNFPETFDAKWIQEGQIVFLKHVEGEEVKFGTMTSEEGAVARLYTWSAGFEYTEDMVEYNQSFNMEFLNEAMGEAHNALLNHIHFSPIIDYSYASDNQTPASTEYDDPAYEGIGALRRKVLNTNQTLKDAVKATRVKDSKGKSRAGSNILLIHSSNEQLIADSLNALQLQGDVVSGVEGITKVIAYDGETITVGEKVHTYSGIPTTKCYLVKPKQFLKELIKHGLQVDADNADISRLVEKQIVGRTRRGVYAGIAQSVEEITLPT